MGTASFFGLEKLRQKRYSGQQVPGSKNAASISEAAFRNIKVFVTWCDSLYWHRY